MQQSELTIHSADTMVHAKGIAHAPRLTFSARHFALAQTTARESSQVVAATLPESLAFPRLAFASQ